VNEFLLPGERLDDLQRDGLKIIQHPDAFRFGMDSVLLAHFASRPYGRLLGCDLGTGSGILPLLVCARMPGAQFDAVEIQPECAERAGRTMKLNGLEEKIRVRCMDLRDAPGILGYGKYDLVICNPPYGRAGGTLLNPAETKQIARHEGDTDITQICASAAKLLRTGGRFCVVFPAHRFLELSDAMRLSGMEPKRVRLIHPFPDRAPNLVLLEGNRGARPGLDFQPPLFVRNLDGQESDELKEIYGK